MTLNVVIDLSHFNNVTDFNAIKADGIVGIIHKATEGLDYTDPLYLSRRSQALAAGLWWGAYHFGTADDGAAQAEHFLSVVNPQSTDLLVLDFEQNTAGPSMTLAGAEQFVTQVQAATTRWPGFYSGSYIKQLLGENQNPTLANCWFWLSEYGPTAHVPANWQTWTLWQYTDGEIGPEPHSVNGVGNCDRDQFNGEMDGLTKLWGYAA
ncbi:MAG TPA: glycoside hydrolase family 25 protein [Pyrinomonadaceae bacterium]|jgi:lysozyme